MTSKKRAIITSTVIAIIVIIIAALFLFSQKKDAWDLSFSIKNETPDIYDTLVESAQKKGQDDAEAYNQAMRTGRADRCDSISDETKKTECRDRLIILMTGTGGDLSVCDGVVDPDRAQECRNTASENYAIAQGNKALCGRITDDVRKKRCREDIDGALLSTLLTKKTATEDRCMALEESFQRECLRSIDTHRGEEQYLTAIKTGNLAMCDAITESSLATTCRDTILLDRAQKEGNAQLCIQVSDPEKKSACISRVSTGNDIATLQDATQKKNLQSCNAISDTNLRNRCHDTIILDLVRTSKNVALCSTLTNTGIIENCQRIQTP